MNKNPNQNQGFLLIGLIIALAIMLVWAAIYFGKQGSGTKSTYQTGQDAIQQTKKNNAILEQQNIDEQDQLNSIDSSPAANQRAIEQAKRVLGK